MSTTPFSFSICRRQALPLGVLTGVLAAMSAVTTPSLAAVKSLRSTRPPSEITVKSGSSIQAAIDTAKPGDTVTIEPGTYAEQIVIRTSGITVYGSGATIVPPALPTANACTNVTGDATNSGVCVIGDVTFAKFDGEHQPVQTLRRSINDVALQRLTIKGFSGAGITAAGASDLTVSGVTLTDNATFGMLALSSPRVAVAGSTVRNSAGKGFVGICVSRSPATLSNNDVSGYFVGLCIESNDTTATGNHVFDNSAGIIVDPHVTGFVGTRNRVEHNNRADERIAGVGILLDGSRGARVEGNVVVGNGKAKSQLGGGIVVTDDPITKVQPRGNIVRHNVTRDNSDGASTFDLVDVGTRSRSFFGLNECVSAQPAALCPPT